MQRRQFTQAALTISSASLLALMGCATPAKTPTKAKVVVIGGGYGGATAAKYVRMFSDYKIDVVLIEPNTSFISCPISNLVIGGSKTIADITSPYDQLSSKHGVQLVKDSVSAIETTKKMITLSGGQTMGYDKLIVSPGIELMMDSIKGLKEAHASGQILQAWKAGAETLALRKQLEAMPDGGIFAISIPEAPYRCPPGPYERASVIADYFKRHKPKSKVLILDANQDVTSKGPLFKKVWATDYKEILEYRPQHNVVGVDVKTKTLQLEAQEDIKADVLNVLPMMRAGSIAVQTGLANLNQRWCGVNYQNFESTIAKDVHVIGDSIQIAPGMPKSGHMANSHGKVVAAAVVAQLSDMPINPAPLLTNTCYSFVNSKSAIHVASVHQYVAAEKTFKTVPGSGGVSPGPTEQEGSYALSWAKTIWADSLA